MYYTNLNIGSCLRGIWSIQSTLRKSCLEHCISYRRNAVTFFLLFIVRPNHSNVASSDKYNTRFCRSSSIICLYHATNVLAFCLLECLEFVLLLSSFIIFVDNRLVLLWFCGVVCDCDIFSLQRMTQCYIVEYENWNKFVMDILFGSSS